MTVEMCCGQRPIVQTGHGRKVGFCIRCGAEYDISPASLTGEMQERYVFYMRGGVTVEPAIMLKNTDCIAGRRDIIAKLK